LLKTRIIPTLLFKRVGLVKGVRFDSWRRVGPALQSIRVYNLREVDELIFLDIAATVDGRRPDFQQIDELADHCFMPMTVGGGVKSLGDIRELLARGADKVSINTAALETPELIRDAAKEFGAQCVVVAIDARRENGRLEVMTHCGRVATGRDPIEWAKHVEAFGAGEVLLTSVDRDGTMQGYDIDLVHDVAEAVSIPVIASGGCGEYRHMAELLRLSRAAALGAASIFHFTEQTPREAKKYLAERGFSVRL
jgi:imidazole glycerol-phosphate synthase subunit HisF